MDLLSQQKQQLRTLIRQKRSALSASEVITKSQLINHNFLTNLLNNIPHQSHDIFSLYLASYNEVTTTLISKHFITNNIKFCYPKIIAPNQHLQFIAAQEGQEFVANNLYPKILEPKLDKASEVVIPQFIILPILGFDHHRNRLGMGGGFFDRTINHLKNLNHKIITIGLAYEFQRAETNIPVENTDQKLDFIVTEKNIFSAN